MAIRLLYLLRTIRKLTLIYFLIKKNKISSKLSTNSLSIPTRLKDKQTEESTAEENGPEIFPSTAIIQKSLGSSHLGVVGTDILNQAHSRGSKPSRAPDMRGICGSSSICSFHSVQSIGLYVAFNIAADHTLDVPKDLIQFQ